MHSAFQYDQFLLKRQVLALTGKIRIYNPAGQLLLFSEQKMFRLKEDIRVYADEGKSQEILHIQARQILDFSAAYDVQDVSTGEKVGVLRRKGFRSMLQDEWEVLDAQDQPIGALREDSMLQAMLRRLLLGSLLPQNYDLLFGQARVADLKQRFNFFRYEMDIDCSMDTARQLDRRMAIAAGILLAIIEGKQSS